MIFNFFFQIRKQNHSTFYIGCYVCIKLVIILYRSFLGAGAKNNTKCWSFSYGIWSFPTVFGLFLRFFQTTVQIPWFFEIKFVVSLLKAAFQKQQYSNNILVTTFWKQRFTNNVLVTMSQKQHFTNKVLLTIFY